jgi:hypothetical protein
MSYITGQRVQSHDGKRHGTVARDATAHSIVYVLWDDEYIPRWELPESVMLQASQPGQSARDAWTNGETKLKARAR